MSENLNNPAFSTSPGNSGLTAREYAAIHLGVPDSGNTEINQMILRSIRAKLVVAALSVPGATADSAAAQATKAMVALGFR